MEVDMTITFSRDEILDMCREKVANINTVIPGEFKVHFDGIYNQKVIAEFVPARFEPAEEPKGVV
jgi:hypothetical protein